MKGMLYICLLLMMIETINANGAPFNQTGKFEIPDDVELIFTPTIDSKSEPLPMETIDTMDTKDDINPKSASVSLETIGLVTVLGTLGISVIIVISIFCFVKIIKLRTKAGKKGRVNDPEAQVGEGKLGEDKIIKTDEGKEKAEEMLKTKDFTDVTINDP